MEKLNECLSLMRRVCNLPSNEDELKKIYTDEQIDVIHQVIQLFDPESNQLVKRWKEINDYVEGRKKHD